MDRTMLFCGFVEGVWPWDRRWTKGTRPSLRQIHTRMSAAYFHRGISRLRAEELLQQAKDDGSFLVRDSETLSGAYVLCLLHQNRVHQYRILPGRDGKLSVQTEGAKQESSYNDLNALIGDYMTKKMKNGLIFAMRFPISPEREEEQDSDEEDQEESRLIPMSPSSTSVCGSESLDNFQERVYTELLQNYSKLDLSSCDDNLKNSMKKYIENGFKKDISTSDTSTLPEFQNMMELAALNLNRELDMYRKKLMLFNNLFDLASIKRRGSLALRQNSVEATTSDIPSMIDKMNQCRDDILTIENKVQEALQYTQPVQYDYPYIDVNEAQVPITTTPFLSSLNTKIVPTTSFDVKMLKHGKIPFKMSLRADIQKGQLLLIKPAKDNLDHTALQQDQICQLVKNTNDNTRLDMILDNKKKQIFCFENVHKRENFCQQIMHMKNKHSKGNNVDQISLFVGTWNMGDKAPTQNISSWLQCHGRGKIMDHKIFGHIPYDIYVIGTQESAMTEKEWVNFIKKQITQCGFAEIEVVEVCTLWGIRLVIIVQKKHWHSINRIQRSSVRTGIANTLGNKGAVGISFYFRGTSFCFINSHLTSGDERNERRNANYRDIIKGLSLGQKHLDLFDVTNQFHHVFWFGDLNYRVEDNIEVILEKCESQDIQYLLGKDQLLKTQHNKKAFCGFEEARIEFMPTYRLPRHKPEYNYDWLKKKNSGDRINAPSFCDRILWRSYPETYIENKTYGCAEKVLGSDHRPVFASFNVGVSSDFVMNRDSLIEDSPVEILFDEIEAQVKTCCKQSFVIEFRSTCLQEFVTSQANATFLENKTGLYTCPVWRSPQLPKLKPLFGDQDYLEEQHIMVAVRSKDGDKESYGECVVALKKKFEQIPQQFECMLLHQGEVTGRLKGKMHVLVGGTSRKKISIKSYELVAFDTDTEEYCDPDLIHSDVTPATPDVIRITQKSQMSPTTTKQTSPLAQFKQKGTSRPVTDMPRSSRSEEYEEISVGQKTRPVTEVPPGRTFSKRTPQYEEIDLLQFPEATQTTGARRKQLPPPSSDSPISFSAPPEVPPPPLPKKQASYVNVIQSASQAMFQQQNQVQPRNDVADWLNGLSLQQYIENFVEHGFDSMKHLRLSRQDLVKIGIKDVTHRDKILSSLFEFDSNC
ncbi:phosphatidylinositol 3,4,5-trisphosphate 5-phosphatase 2-like isoform X5 [Mytilus edulis]|uniref:phosphatidylinositol 3,4,5-trisphosphate 5-phosphatase 2-like isoform X5 n=1 Tax=Mytilus edulis TaxID=6550 RepID=UPI0039F13BFF